MFCQKIYSEKFIEEVVSSLDYWNKKWTMSSICRFQKLSERFMERWIEDLDWDEISEHQDLSEEFMRRHKREINWLVIRDREIPLPKDLEIYLKVYILLHHN